MNDGFVDLRQNTQGLGDGFWASFTDIMTVIVMIFLIASSVLILQNWELMTRLQMSEKAELEAADKAQIVTKEKLTAEEQLAESQHQLSLLRMKLMNYKEQQQQLKMSLNQSNHDLWQNNLDFKALKQQFDQLNHEKVQSQQQQDLLSQKLQQESEHLTKQQFIIQTLQQKLVKQQKIAQLSKRLLQQQQQNHQQLNQGFQNLQTKYDKLVRPTRSAKGKYLVEVRYKKGIGENILRLRLPNQTQLSKNDDAYIRKKIKTVTTARC